MTLRNIAGRAVRTLGFAAAVAGVVGLSALPQPAHALSTGAAVGIGLGALAVGTAVGAATAQPYPYPQSYYPPQYYYGPAQPTYPAYPSGSCWSPNYGRYVPC